MWLGLETAVPLRLASAQSANAMSATFRSQNVEEIARNLTLGVSLPGNLGLRVPQLRYQLRFSVSAFSQGLAGCLSLNIRPARFLAYTEIALD